MPLPSHQLVVLAVVQAEALAAPAAGLGAAQVLVPVLVPLAVAALGPAARQVLALAPLLAARLAAALVLTPLAAVAAHPLAAAVEAGATEVAVVLLCCQGHPTFRRQLCCTRLSWPCPSTASATARWKTWSPWW